MQLNKPAHSRPIDPNDYRKLYPFQSNFMDRNGLGYHFVDQGTGDLGDRMQRMFNTLPVGPVVIIGSDIPNIECADIAEAFNQLGRHDAVFGPAPDGGYWLVGQSRRRTVLQIFGNVRWSSEHALADTMKNLKGTSVNLLRQLADVDDAASYRNWLRGK